MSNFLFYYSYNLPFRYTLLNICLMSLVFILSFILLFVKGDMSGIVFSMYGILGCVAFSFFCRYVSFRQKSRKENHQQFITTSIVFPVFRYDTEKNQMVQADDLPLYAFINIGIVIFWSMLFCILSVKFYLFGMFLMCLAFSIGTIYATEVIFTDSLVNLSIKVDRNRF